MSINNINNTPGVNVDSRRVANDQAAAAKQAPADAPRQASVDAVSLTSSAQELQKLQAKAVEAPMNKEKVETLRAAILNGEYRVDPEALANKISKLEHEIFGA
jgi:negative regulator of flagellin synthesis FlgM